MKESVTFRRFFKKSKSLHKKKQKPFQSTEPTHCANIQTINRFSFRISSEIHYQHTVHVLKKSINRKKISNVQVDCCERKRGLCKQPFWWIRLEKIWSQIDIHIPLWRFFFYISSFCGDEFSLLFHHITLCVGIWTMHTIFPLHSLTTLVAVCLLNTNTPIHGSFFMFYCWIRKKTKQKLQCIESTCNKYAWSWFTHSIWMTWSISKKKKNDAFFFWQKVVYDLCIYYVSILD